ncbi:MAG: hypothetical protein P1U89_01915 [Verrucomicrobiales bacterium]|nr:hypothetical protein [Verrucomicrobiales bacterium]
MLYRDGEMDHPLFTTAEGIRRLERELLPGWIKERRWFAGKARSISGLRIVQQISLGPARILAVEVYDPQGNTETYAIPLAVSENPITESIIAPLGDEILFDAAFDPAFQKSLLQLMYTDDVPAGFEIETGSILSENISTESKLFGGEQSNSAIIYGDRIFVKLYRKLSAGKNPDGELTRFLSEEAGFPHVAPFAGSVAWNNASLALATGMVGNRGDAWTLALQECETGLTVEWKKRMESLGRITGGMHLALATWDPEPFREADGEKVGSGIESLSGKMAEMLKERGDSLPPQIRGLAEKASALSSRLRVEITSLSGRKIRTHGDYHLGQVLDTGDDFVIIDFEGEPSRSLEERRAKYVPQRDVAGMLRSIHYAAHASAKLKGGVDADHTESWAGESQDHFLGGWEAAISGSVLETESSLSFLRLYLLEKALYEVIYELNHRPDWLEIPLRGLISLFESPDA